jgi:hypothetical protein
MRSKNAAVSSAARCNGAVFTFGRQVISRLLLNLLARLLLLVSADVGHVLAASDQLLRALPIDG